MSARNFINLYNNVLVSACKHKNIKIIPFPKNKINTDRDIKKYSIELDNYIRDGNLKNPENFVFKHVVHKFPEVYFSRRQ